MERSRWQRVGEIFEAVADLDGDDRARALAGHCAGDDELRREVESLLAADTDAESWLAGLTARSGIPNPEAEAALNEPGRRIGAWRLVRQIGRGGMGVVYLAERADDQFRMQAALKALPVGLITHEAVARFEREREILAGLEHPGIARLLDGGVTPEGTPYYVMEYVDGLTLDRYCDERGPGLIDRIRLFEKVAAAVAYAHRHLVIHRDVKPANILVTSEGEPRLLDFGVAKLLADEGEATGTATGLAQRRVTPAYTAPELLQGEPATTACDVYSLGVVLYELLADKSPFGPGFFDRAGWTDRIATRRPSPPSKAAGGAVGHRLKGDLDNIVAMAMHPDPVRRYATVNALLADLERHRKRLPVAARPDSAGYRVGRFLRRHAVAAGLSAAVVVALVGGAGLALWQAHEARQQAALARAERDRAETVAGFLKGIFAGVNPRQGGDLETRVRGLIERADVGTEVAEDEHPVTRAELLQSYAVVLRSLGRLDEAERVGRRALGLVREAGAEPAAVAAAEVNVANTLVLAVDLEEAEALLRSAMETLPLDDAASETAFTARISLLQLFASDRRGPERRLTLLDRLEPFEERMRELNESLWMSFAMAKLQTLLHAGRYDRALAQGRGTADWVRENRGDDHPWLGDTLSYVSGALFELGRPGEAERVDRETLAIYRGSMGADHPMTIGIHNQLATSLAQQGKYEAAIEHYQRAIEGWRGVHGDKHPYISRALTNAAQAQRKLGRMEEALDTLGRAYRMEKDLLGLDHPQTNLTRILYGRLLGEAGRLTEAQGHFDAGLGVVTGTWGENHPVALRLRAEYGRFLIRRARSAAALSLLETIRPGLEEAYGAEGIYPSLALAYQGLAEAELDRAEAAAEHLSRARAVLARDAFQPKYSNILASVEATLERIE